MSWRKEWDQCNAAWDGGALSIPKGQPTYLGYVIQMHNVRASSPEGMTAGWGIYGKQIESAVNSNIVSKLKRSNQVVDWRDHEYKLGQIPNLHSLIPYSLEAKKPVFDCVSSDGLRGAHLKRAVESQQHFEQIVELLQVVAGW